MSDYLVSMARRAKFGERNASRKLAMIAMCNAASDNGDAIVMAAAEIAEAAELASVKNAMRVRKELVAIGLIEPVSVDGEPKAGHGQGAKGRYRVNVKRLESLFHGEWDFGAEARQIRRGGKYSETPPNGDALRVPSRHLSRVLSEHPTDDERVVWRHPKTAQRTGNNGAVLGAAKGAALSAATPQSPLNVGEVYNNLSPTLTLPTLAIGRESGRGFADILQELRSAKPTCRRAIDALIDPLLRLRRFEAPDPVFALGMIAESAQNHPDDVLRDAVERVRKARGALVKASDLESALKEAIAHAKLVAPLHRRATPAQIAGADPAVLAMGAQVRDALKARLGNEVFASWFTGFEFERFEEDRIVASVAVKFFKTYIEQNFIADVEACARAVFPGAERLEIVVRQVETQHA